MTLRNVDKTFSLEEQRQEINEIAVDLDAINTTLTNLNTTQWDSAYSWGDHALAGYWVDDSASRTNWDTAYGWGDHGSAGYWLDDSASRTNWDSAYGWGDHGSAGYWLDDSASRTNWDSAYGWGDHSSAGYATTTDVNTAVTNSSNWDTAHGWGDHALSGYATTTDVNTAVTNSSNWDSAYGWGDHSSAGYLTSYTETQTLDDVLTLGASTTQNITTTGNLSSSNVGLTNATTAAKLNVSTDISGNYTGWKEKGVASGSMSATSIASKTPTINDFTYPNNSNGMLIWSTSKIGFAAGSESPQYGTGVQMLFDSDGLILGGIRAFDRTTTTSAVTNHNIRLKTNGDAEFAGTVSDSLGPLRRLGLNNPITSDYTLVGSDIGKMVVRTGGNITVADIGTASAGDMITIMNNSGTSMTITRSSFTLYNTADGADSDKTLAARGVATLVFIATNVAYISGGGLT